MEMLLTVEQAAERLQLHPETVRRQLKRGELRAIKRGRVWRVPESALGEATPDTHKVATQNASTPQTRAAAILAALDSGDMKRRNAAIIELARSDAATGAIVEAAAAKAVEEYDGPDDDFADWHALDGEPFHFPEEAPDYLDNLYRADKAPQGTSAFDEETR